MKNTTRNVRQYVRTRYIEPARCSGNLTVTVIAGEVQKGVGLQNRVPLVCQALKSKKFLKENDLILEKVEGPPSGMSTTVKFTYRLANKQEAKPAESPILRLLELRGLGKEVFASLGGGEAYLRKEREDFYPPGDPRRDW